MKFSLHSPLLFPFSIDQRRSFRLRPVVVGWSLWFDGGLSSATLRLFRGPQPRPTAGTVGYKSFGALRLRTHLAERRSISVALKDSLLRSSAFNWGSPRAINIAPLAAPPRAGCPESKQPQDAMTHQPGTMSITPIRRRWFGLSAHTLRFTDGTRRQTTASRPRSMASGGRSMASGGRAMTSGGRAMTSGGRSIASGRRAMAIGGRSLASAGRSLASGSLAMAADFRAMGADGRATTAVTREEATDRHVIAADGLV